MSYGIRSISTPRLPSPRITPDLHSTIPAQRPTIGSHSTPQEKSAQNAGSRTVSPLFAEAPSQQTATSRTQASSTAGSALSRGFSTFVLKAVLSFGSPMILGAALGCTPAESQPAPEPFYPLQTGGLALTPNPILATDIQDPLLLAAVSPGANASTDVYNVSPNLSQIEVFQAGTAPQVKKKYDFSPLEIPTGLISPGSVQDQFLFVSYASEDSSGFHQSRRPTNTTPNPCPRSPSTPSQSAKASSSSTRVERR